MSRVVQYLHLCLSIGPLTGRLALRVYKTSLCVELLIFWELNVGQMCGPDSILARWNSALELHKYQSEASPAI